MNLLKGAGNTVLDGRGVVVDLDGRNGGNMLFGHGALQCWVPSTMARPAIARNVSDRPNRLVEAGDGW
jgi:hypothetical protein